VGAPPVFARAAAAEPAEVVAMEAAPQPRR
jgi:hypothetical protein